MIEGLAKMSSDWATGNHLQLPESPPAAGSAKASMLKRGAARRYDVVACATRASLGMKRETFHRLLDHSIPFNRFIVTQINERLGLFISLLESERLADVDARRPRHRRPVPPRAGTSARISISQEEIPAACRRFAPASIAPCKLWRSPDFSWPSTAA